ncbi:hypothetical protein TSUD_295560 [Trifolium subterraneum]|uniref:Uncharacterized protein n=1 Tax=Trifolium subterraneum TaxID=3900 RepID=A0A2Z6N8X0_TRISU|nr:hypothetical protein TSUD_295560 [Trifolium subterraneum]
MPSIFLGNASLQQLVVKGNRLAIEIPYAAYHAGLEACKHNLHGRILWPKGSTPLSVVSVKEKLFFIWKELSKWGIISLGSLGTLICTDVITAKPMYERTFGQFSSVLVDIDISQPLRYKLLVERKGYAFFVELENEHIPDFCNVCKVIGHHVDNCKRLNKDEKLKTDKEVNIKKQLPAEPSKVFAQTKDGRPQQSKPKEIINVDNEVINVEETSGKSLQASLKDKEPDNVDLVNNTLLNTMQRQSDNKDESVLSSKAILREQDKQLEEELNDSTTQLEEELNDNSIRDANKELIASQSSSKGSFVAATQITTEDTSSSAETRQTPDIVLQDMAFLNESWAYKVLEDSGPNLAIQDKGFQIYLEDVQDQIQQDGHTDSLLEQEKLASTAFEDALNKQEAFWPEKANLNWHLKGYRNTQYFHRLAKIKTSTKFISSLQDGEHESFLVEEVIPNLIYEEVNTLLTMLPSYDEIKSAVFSLNKDSAPGPDGFGAFFFQHYWDIVKEDVLNVVLDFFTTSWILPGFNSNLIALIPKIPDATSIDQFRPITMANFKFKIISKIIVDRLASILPTIVSDEQNGFIHERNIKNCLCVASKAVNLLHNKSFGGVRQGNPLSPLLFCLAEDVLSRSISKLVADGKLDLIKGTRNCRVPSHSFYADDLMIFCKGKLSGLKALKDLFNLYALESGQVIMNSKSTIFSGSITKGRLALIVQLLNFNIAWKAYLLSIVGRVQLDLYWAKVIWTPDIPPSKSLFAWRLMHGKVPTDENLMIRGCCIASMCNLCNSHEESSFHPFFECAYAIRLWSWLASCLNIVLQFTTIDDMWKLCDLNWSPQCKVTVTAAIINLFNTIWFVRNQARYNNKVTSWRSAISMIIANTSLTGNNTCKPSSNSIRDFTFLKMFRICIHHPKVPILKEILWQPPLVNWFKCNIDGASCGNPGNASCGGIFTDSNANFIYAVSEPLGVAFSYFAELCGAMQAIEIAFQRGWSNIWLETDSTLVVTAFKNPAKPVAWQLRNRWKNVLVMARSLNFIVSHICREGNEVAGLLANHGLSLGSLTYWSDSPLFISECLKKNKLGMPSFRVCSS